MISIDQHRLRAVCDGMKGKRVAVIGDVMLDRYLWGRVNRLSPEAPVPVIDLDREQSRPGGASNVAQNIHSLGGRPLLVGVVGDDATGRELAGILRESGLSTEGLFTDASRPTTTKTRIIAHSQHVARVDRETREPIGPAVTKAICSFIESGLGDIDGIIFEDYNKGVIGRELISTITGLARGRGIPVAVDPKFDNFFDYPGVTVFKPNKHETEEALGLKLSDAAGCEAAGRSLMAKLRPKNILLTLGDQGMMLFEEDGSVSHVPTKARKVADVSGAGDTVIATLTMGLLGGATMREAASLANFSGGIVCGYVGIVPIDREELMKTVLAEINHGAPHPPGVKKA
jgi:rfaE bifunctional protein kinase chain/domain